MKNTHILGLTGTLALGLILTGCQPDTTVPGPATKGKAVITVGGLPAGTDAKVSLTGPNAFKSDFTSSKTLEGLDAGSYNLVAQSVTVGADSFTAAVNPATFQVKAGETSSASVTYTKVIVPVPVEVGKLSVTISGLPAGTDAKVSVSGPNAFKSDFTASKTLEGLAEGSYNISALNVVIGADTYNAVVTPASVNVKKNETSSGTVVYTKVVVPPSTGGKLNVTVIGLPTEVNAQVDVLGPNQYKNELTKSALLESLEPGRYNISAKSIFTKTTAYVASIDPSPSSVEVKMGETANTVVTYSKFVIPVYPNRYIRIFTPDPVPVPVIPGNTDLLFASFDSSPEIRSVQGGNAYNFQYSQNAGDAVAAPIVKSSNTVSTPYTLSAVGGSAFGGVATVIEGKPDDDSNAATPPPATNVSTFTKIRLFLASSVATTLQVRVAGNDADTLNSGCYPVALVNVTPSLTAYTLNLDDATFASRSYCSPAQVKTMAQTLPNLVRIEVEDNALPAAGTKNSTMTLGTIEFLR